MSSTYCTETDLIYAFGTTAISDWSNIDGNATYAAARITDAIASAGDEIDAVMRCTQYSYRIPLVTAAGGTPGMIKRIAVVLAGAWLYEALGARQRVDGKALHQLEFRLAWARARLEEIRQGQLVLDAVS